MFLDIDEDDEYNERDDASSKSICAFVAFSFVSITQT